MRMIKRLLILSFFLAFAAGCETYDDYKIEYSSVYPLSGEWMVRFTTVTKTVDGLTDSTITSGLIVLSTFNTADNSTTQMWIRATSSSTNAAYTGRFTGKINCNVADKTFTGDNTVNTYFSSGTIPTFTISAGTIVTDGYDTASKGKSDKITFTMIDTRKPGKTYTVSGFRRTRWAEDEV